MPYTMPARAVANRGEVLMGRGEYTDGRIKVTVRLLPTLVKRAKLEAIKRDTSLQALIERGLQMQLRAVK
jgi:predicted HicB family RNase H-like nuclease